MMGRKIFLSALTIVYFLIVEQAVGEITMKLGTLATEGSEWDIALKQMNAELMERSQGQIRFIFVRGSNEDELVDRAEEGQCKALSLIAPGLGQILEEFFIFQSPMLFSTYEELDYVRERLTPEFSKKLADKGYVLLGWGDLGFIYLFSKTPIRTQTDLQNTRNWAWKIDPIGRAFVSMSGSEPYTLPIQEVPQALREDKIQTVYNSPLACMSFGWHTEVRYMSDLRLAVGVGATIIKKRHYDMLSDEHKVLLQEIARKYHNELVKTIRMRNDESINALEKHGTKIVDVPQREKERWERVARGVQNRFAGDLYPQELLERIRDLLDEYKSRP